MKELVAGARWNLRPCARSPRLRMSFRLRKRARNQRTWTVPPTGAFPTRTRGFHGVNCRANARFGSVVEGAELQFVPPRGIGPRRRPTERGGASRLRRRVRAHNRVTVAVSGIIQPSSFYCSVRAAPRPWEASHSPRLIPLLFFPQGRYHVNIRGC